MTERERQIHRAERIKRTLYAGMPDTRAALDAFIARCREAINADAACDRAWSAYQQTLSPPATDGGDNRRRSATIGDATDGGAIEAPGDGYPATNGDMRPVGERAAAQACGRCHGGGIVRTVRGDTECGACGGTGKARP